MTQTLNLLTVKKYVRATTRLALASVVGPYRRQRRPR